MKGALRKRVARALEADDETVADELAVPCAAQDRNVLDARRAAGAAIRDEHQRDDQNPHHPPPTLDRSSGWTAPDTVTPLSLLRTLTTSPIEPS